MKYCTPEKYFYRIHHVRPRFKNNVEAVLLFIADAISSANSLPIEDFKRFLIDKIYMFPGNQNKKKKTMQNWRTEISALFSLYFDNENISTSSALADDLSESQDLTRFFKYFLYTFQYPGGHIKPTEVQNLIKKKVLFHPTNYLLRVLNKLREFDSKEGYLTTGESCHMIFNDLRGTRDFNYENINEISERILYNRKNKSEYNLSGDVIRYAGDILDYMGLANLVKGFGGKFFINTGESRSIKKFIMNKEYFEYKDIELKEISLKEKDWVNYVCRPVENKIFNTDILAFISKDEEDYKELIKRTEHLKRTSIPTHGVRAKDIGDYGESLVHGHECMYLKVNNRKDLIHLVKCIPNHFAMGFDIQSIDLNEIKKYIEVKSTISNKRLTVNRFRLTQNEIKSAQTLGEHYFVYRLQIDKTAGDQASIKLFIIRDPIQLFKKNEISIELSTGEVNLRSYQGECQPLLYWKE